MTKLLLSVLAASSLLRADFNPQHWQYRTAVHLAAPTALSEITLDSGVYRHSLAQLNDLRLIRDGSEVPYELEVSAGSREEVNLPLRIVNKAIVPGQGLQATLDLTGHPQHNRLRITTAQRNFKEIVRIETSDDARLWSLARAEALIFDISRQDRTASDLTAEYPLSTRRYVRLTIAGWKDPAYLESVSLLQVTEKKAIRDRGATLTPIVNQDAASRTSSYTSDIGWQGQPYDEVELSVGQELFFRNVEVFTSNDGASWQFAGASVISNRPDNPQLQIQFAEQWNRYLKLTVSDGDSPSVTVKSVTLHALRRTLRFSSSRGGHYSLYSGNALANAPRYDLTQIATDTASSAAASLGPPETNPQYESAPVPWTDRNPHLLTGLVIAAAVLMGVLTVRLLLRLKAA